MNAFMRLIFRSPIILLTLFSLLSMTSLVVAQQGKKPASPVANQPAAANTPPGRANIGKPPAAQPGAEEPPVRQASEKKARPAPQDFEIDKLPPELEKILARWETESAKIKSLHGRHSRSEFNKTFAVEKVSEGEFFLETPDKGRIDMIAKAPKKDEVSSRKDAEGKPYELEKGSSERWICTGEEILSFNEDDKTYSREELPESMRGKNIVHSPLPFLFGMKAEEAKSRFNMSLISVGKDSVKLKAVPRMDNDRQNYHEAWIILDTKRYIPTAVRLIDPNGLETVYMFKDITINDGNFGARIVSRFRGNPYKPSLAGYKRHIPNEVEPASSNAPRDGKPQTRQAGGPVGGAGAPKRGPNEVLSDRPQPPRTTTVPQPGKK